MCLHINLVVDTSNASIFIGWSGVLQDGRRMNRIRAAFVGHNVGYKHLEHRRRVQDQRLKPRMAHSDVRQLK